MLHLDPGVPEDCLDVPLYQRLDQPSPAIVTVAEDLVELPFELSVALGFFLLPLGPVPLPFGPFPLPFGPLPLTLLLRFPESPVEFDGLSLPLRLASGFPLRDPASLRREFAPRDPRLPGGGVQDAPDLRRGRGGPPAARLSGHREFSLTP